jgi:phosphoribosylamine---glycine ligase
LKRKVMKILVIGSGGREHALTWKLSRSSLVKNIVAAPGNSGIASLAECVSISPDNIDEIVSYASTRRFDLVVPGPEAPLALGITDKLLEAGIPVYGPKEKAAQLESSKVFAKNFCTRHQIPTAAYDVCQTIDSTRKAAEKRLFNCVIKADGLAAGKGVFVCCNRTDVQQALNALFQTDQFAQAASSVIVEDKLEGEEVSILAIVDGTNYIILESSQDHKPIFDHDKGPNTGGMGAYSPAPVVTDDILEKIETTIIQPTVTGMKSEGHPFCGTLYAGLMISKKIPKVLEFNVRFGDPETQPLLCRLKSDLAELLMAAAKGNLDTVTPPVWSPNSAVCVIMASGGYPGYYQKGYEIFGLDEANYLSDIIVFHAGTSVNDDGRLVTAGGRVLGVTASGATIDDACHKAYNALEYIRFKDAFYRKDIAYRALQRSNN